MTRRLLRDVAGVSLVLALVAWVGAPGRPLLALGVAGGGGLALMAIWAIGSLVDGLTRGVERGEIRRISGVFALVKFFTRHAILAFVGYGMMLGLHFDPVGMLVGVSTVLVAAAMEAARSWRPARRP